MAQALIKLIPLPSLGEVAQLFGCEINGKRYKVEPRNHLDIRTAKDGIPVRANGIRHMLFSEYNASQRTHQIHLYADIGPYKGYKGPRLINQQFDVTKKAFAEHFNIVLWKRENGSLWACRVKNMEEVEEHLTDGWEVAAP